MAVEQGADEVDIVLALNAFLAGDYERAAEEIRQVRACIDAVAARQGREVHLKVILEVCFALRKQLLRHHSLQWRRELTLSRHLLERWK